MTMSTIMSKPTFVGTFFSFVLFSDPESILYFFSDPESLLYGKSVDEDVSDDEDDPYSKIDDDLLQSNCECLSPQIFPRGQ